MSTNTGPATNVASDPWERYGGFVKIGAFLLAIWIATHFGLDLNIFKKFTSGLGIKPWSWEFWAAGIVLILALGAIADLLWPRKEEKDKKPWVQVAAWPLAYLVIALLAIHWWANRGEVWQMEFTLLESHRDRAHQGASNDFVGEGVTKITEDMFTSNVYNGRWHLKMKARRKRYDPKDSNAVHYYEGMAEVTGCAFCTRRHPQKLSVEVRINPPQAVVHFEDERGTKWQGLFWLPDTTDAYDPDDRLPKPKKEVVPKDQMLAQGQK